MTQERALDEQKAKARKPETSKSPDKRHAEGAGTEAPALLRLQKQVGNRAVQRLLAQRSADGAFELDDETSGRINQARGGGQPLDGALQKQMGESMGHNFSGVRVHTGTESDALNQQLSAKAFTTGQDVFVRSGDYNPASSGGKELIAHELTHVVQQGTGRVSGGGSGMTVRPAGDAFEQEADATAHAATAGGPVQRQEEEEEVQAKALQRQEEEEEPLQAMALQRQEEEELQAMPLQRQEEEELQAMPLQRQEEEEEPLQAMALQRQEEEEEVQAKTLQRQEEIPEEEV